MLLVGLEVGTYRLGILSIVSLMERHYTGARVWVSAPDNGAVLKSDNRHSWVLLSWEGLSVWIWDGIWSGDNYIGQRRPRINVWDYCFRFKKTQFLLSSYGNYDSSYSYIVNSYKCIWGLFLNAKFTSTK